MKRRPLILTLCFATVVLVAGQQAAYAERPAVAKSQSLITERYSDAARKLIAAALNHTEGLRRLQYLCDRIGNRFSGSASLERAIEWAAAEMRNAGLENVETPPVKIPHWIRGNESAMMLSPVQKPLAILGFGMSVATPPEGLTGEVLMISALDQLNVLGRDRVAGKVVLIVPATTEKTYSSEAYQQSVASGPARAAGLGAVAVLIRSGSRMLGPRIRGLNYPEGAARIPAAALSVEDSEMIQRLTESGTPVRIRLMMEARQEPDVESHNVVGELRGREEPKEVVVVGGHIDSWDVGQGADDDGSGIMAALDAVTLIKQLKLAPRRTIRVVFWVNEENGHAGGRAYATMLGDTVKNHVAAIQMDCGSEKPVGFGFGAAEQQTAFPAAFQRAVEIGGLLKTIGGGQIGPNAGGGDLFPLLTKGVPTFATRTVRLHYDEWRHTNADTFDKIVPRDYQLNVASLAVLSYVLADMPERLDQMK